MLMLMLDASGTGRSLSPGQRAANRRRRAGSARTCSGFCGHCGRCRDAGVAGDRHPVLAGVSMRTSRHACPSTDNGVCCSRIGNTRVRRRRAVLTDAGRRTASGRGVRAGACGCSPGTDDVAGRGRDGFLGPAAASAGGAPPGKSHAEETSWYFGSRATTTGWRLASTSRTASSASSPSAPTPSTTAGDSRRSGGSPHPRRCRTRRGSGRAGRAPGRGVRRPATPQADELQLLALVIEMYEKHRWPFELPGPGRRDRSSSSDQRGLLEARPGGVPRQPLARVRGAGAQARAAACRMIRALHEGLGIPARGARAGDGTGGVAPPGPSRQRRRVTSRAGGPRRPRGSGRGPSSLRRAARRRAARSAAPRPAPAGGRAASSTRRPPTRRDAWCRRGRSARSAGSACACRAGPGGCRPAPRP